MIGVKEELEPDAYFLPKSAALSYIHADLKRATNWITVGDKLLFDGPMCECCHNRCNINELAQYCKDPKAARNFLSVTGI